MNWTIIIFIISLYFLIALIFGVIIFGIPGIGKYLTSLGRKEIFCSFSFLLVLLSLVSLLSISLTYIYIERSYFLVEKFKPIKLEQLEFEQLKADSAIHLQSFLEDLGRIKKELLKLEPLDEQGLQFSAYGSYGGWEFKEPKYKSLVRGKIAYDVKDSMKVGSQYKAVVSITKALNDSILFLNLDSTKFKVEEIKISSRVRVSLLDPSSNKNFDIVALNTEEQLVDTASNTIWSWNINPLQSGKNTLILRANVKVISDLGETSKDITVFEKSISVHASPLLSVKQFLIDNWQWVLGTILLPLLVWRYQLLIRKKKTGTKRKKENDK